MIEANTGDLAQLIEACAADVSTDDQVYFDDVYVGLRSSRRQ